MAINDASKQSSETVIFRAVLALVLPPAAALISRSVLFNSTNASGSNIQAVTAVLMSSVVIVSWLMGLRWYGLKGMGLRGGRPLTSGIGFAAFGWIIFLILRFIFVGIVVEYPENSARTYFYLLLFESFATQIWTFGVFFRAVADWRGPLTAAISSGILFGLVSVLIFQEVYTVNISSVIYFISWGLLYGIIRLRSGSLLGPALVQSVQSFTAWVVISPGTQVDPGQLQNLYLTASIAYLLIIWRLWPRKTGDYRV